MDHFKEEVVVARNSLLKNILYMLCWVLIVVFGLYGMLMLQMLMFTLSVGAVVLALLSIGAADFSVKSMRTVQGYCYAPGGRSEWNVLYLLAGLALPLGIAFAQEKIQKLMRKE